MSGNPAPEKVAALGMALHKTRWSNDADEFDLGLARERAVEMIDSLNAAGYDVARIEEGERLDASADIDAALRSPFFWRAAALIAAPA